MSPTVTSLRGAVLFGIENGKRNVIADLAPLKELFDSHAQLVAACESMLGAIDGSFAQVMAAAGLMRVAVAKATMTDARCTHPDRGATVAVTCPKCNTRIALPADPVDHATDRFCPVCNAQVPYLPAMA